MTLHVIAGPPCSGKSTYITEHRSTDALVIDLDAIAHALGYPKTHVDPDDPSHPAALAASIVRRSLLNKLDRFKRSEIWIIDTNATNQWGSIQVTRLDPGPAECHRRADTDHRHPKTHQLIDQWYAGRTPTTPSRSW